MNQIQNTDGSVTLTADGGLEITRQKETPVVLTPGSTVNIDFNAGNVFTLALDQATTFTTSNRSNNRNVVIKLLCDGTTRALTFPSWIFVGAAAPSQIVANKTGILSLSCFGENETDIVAAYAEQP